MMRWHPSRGSSRTSSIGVDALGRAVGSRATSTRELDEFSAQLAVETVLKTRNEVATFAPREAKPIVVADRDTNAWAYQLAVAIGPAPGNVSLRALRACRLPRIAAREASKAAGYRMIEHACRTYDQPPVSGSCRPVPATMCRHPMELPTTAAADAIADFRAQLGRQLADYRRAAGYSQAQLAKRIDYARSTVANVEIGRQNVGRQFWERCEAALGAHGALLTGYTGLNALSAERQKNRATEHASPSARDAIRVLKPTFARLQPKSGPVAVDAFDAGTLEHRVLEAVRTQRHPAQVKPLLTLVGGYAGSGKSEFGRFLSSITGWTLLDKDTLTRPLVEGLLMSLGGDPNDRHTALYRERVRPLEYRCLLSTAYENLMRGISTVVAAPFVAEIADEAWLGRMLNRCAERAIDVAVVWMHCDLDSMRDYLQSRGAARDTWKLTAWEEYAATVDLSLRPRCDHIVVDNRLNAATSLAEQARSLVAQAR
jgi:transcriptional regulator with XRE-family HTH domain/predicted kinase